MLPLAPDPLSQRLHEANSRLAFWLDSLILDPARPDAKLRPAAPQQMAGLLSEMMRTGEWMRRLPEKRTPELERELGEYRKNVERLRDLLPAIHRSLVQERSRLDQERARVNAAAEWARRSSQTL